MDTKNLPSFKVLEFVKQFENPSTVPARLIHHVFYPTTGTVKLETDAGWKEKKGGYFGMSNCLWVPHMRTLYKARVSWNRGFEKALEPGVVREPSCIYTIKEAELVAVYEGILFFQELGLSNNFKSIIIQVDNRDVAKDLRRCLNGIPISDANPFSKDLYIKIRNILKDLGVVAEISGVSGLYNTVAHAFVSQLDENFKFTHEEGEHGYKVYRDDELRHLDEKGRPFKALQKIGAIEEDNKDKKKDVRLYDKHRRLNYINGVRGFTIYNETGLAAIWNLDQSPARDLRLKKDVDHVDVDRTNNKITSILKSPKQLSRLINTGVKPEILKNVGKAITTLPENFKPHRAVKRIFEDRAKMIETGEGIDWAVGEALAFATLLVEGNHVRLWLSGQDVERGTFSHRHFVLHDQETGEKYCPLDHVVMSQNEEMFTISNSSLSEFGELGFELGYSMENPNSLVLWEAQFGDFSNGAQVMFDQFVSSGEAKWLRQSGLVVLLPHGYNGQGPEHSSARLECFLQMSDDHPFVIPDMDSTLREQIQECNWQVVNVTTPANYFHVLRRQIHREFHKPLIVMSPKNLLLHKDCKSNLSEFDDVQGHPGFDKKGTGFKRLIKDQNDHSDCVEGIRRLVLCSGKVYYELDEERRKVEGKDIAICRVEQLCPFPYDLVQHELKRYPNAEVVWCQEEPMNMGAYSYIAPRLGTAMKAMSRGTIDDIKYVGRAPPAATATGFYQDHVKEQTEIVQKAVQPDPIN